MWTAGYFKYPADTPSETPGAGWGFHISSKNHFVCKTQSATLAHFLETQAAEMVG